MYDDKVTEISDLFHRGGKFAVAIINHIQNNPNVMPHIDSITDYILTEIYDWRVLHRLHIGQVNELVYNFARAYANLQKGREDQEVKIVYVPPKDGADVPPDDELH